MSAAESGLIVPQPHAATGEKLVVPAYYEDRFSRVTQLALQSGNVLPPHIVAAVTISDNKELSEDAMARQAIELADAESYLGEHPGEPFININRASFDAGIAADSNGLSVFNWNSPVDVATGLAIPSEGNVKIEFSATRIHSIQAEIPSGEPAKVITPGTAVTPETTGDEGLVEAAQEDGVLVVGEKAVTAFVEAVSELPHRPETRHLKQAIRIAMPILEFERG